MLKVLLLVYEGYHLASAFCVSALLACYVAHNMLMPMENAAGSFCAVERILLSAVAAGWGRGHVPPSASREKRAPKGDAVFLQHEIYKNSVSCVEAGMGIEGQIICIEQRTF